MFCVVWVYFCTMYELYLSEANCRKLVIDMWYGVYFYARLFVCIVCKQYCTLILKSKKQSDRKNITMQITQGVISQSIDEHKIISIHLTYKNIIICCPAVLVAVVFWEFPGLEKQFFCTSDGDQLVIICLDGLYLICI